jgi:hypothetical protein
MCPKGRCLTEHEVKEVLRAKLLELWFLLKAKDLC